MDRQNSIGYSLRQRSPRTINSPAKRQSPIILIVEDEDNLAELLALRLGRKHLATVIAHDGRTACQMAVNCRPDLILLDIMLPEMDGWEVCSFIRSHREQEIADVPIIMLSALCSLDTKYKGQSVGADAFLRKPYDFEQIFTKINLLLPVFGPP